MYNIFCSDTENSYSIFDEHPKKPMFDPNICELIVVGEAYMEFWTGPAILKNYLYKRTLNKA